MLNLKPSSNSDQRTLSFLAQNPSLSQSLFADFGHDLNQVATIIEPVLDAPSRCEVSVYYIQAVTTGRTAFLTTNLPDVRCTHVTGVATSWLIGRSRTCAIAIPSSSVSRCHAVIGYCPERGFYMMDIGSSNGTFVNRHRLTALEQRVLSDADLIEFSHTHVEFFVAGWRDQDNIVHETLV
jgi:pSer/pThr/pTyr-binding forkhead associated (FHA) protein